MLAVLLRSSLLIFLTRMGKSLIPPPSVNSLKFRDLSQKGLASPSR